MCVMCLIRSEQDFDPDYIETIYNRGNNDGFGLAYVEGERDERGRLVKPGRVRAVKSMGSPSELKDIYQEHRGKNLIMHLRNATHGDKNLENCHPYWIFDIDKGDPMDLVMMHNGTIPNVQIDRAFSDSYNFATIHLRNFLKTRPSALQDESFRFLLCALIGSNKLIFLDNRERVTIINYEMGSIHEPTGVWISNKDYLGLPKKAPAPTPVHQFCGMNPQMPGKNFASSSTRMQGKAGVLGTVSWEDKDEGRWVMEADGRSHFIPQTKGSEERERHPILLPSAQPASDEIKEMIKKASPPTSEDDIESLRDSLGKTTQAEMFLYAKEFPVEAATVIKWFAEKTNLLDEFKKTSLEDIVVFCIESSWEAGYALAIACRGSIVKEKEKVHEVN